jgi:large subunit ribosomal protein L32
LKILKKIFDIFDFYGIIAYVRFWTKSLECFKEVCKMGAICPKNRTSKARRDSRRANWKMTAPNLVKCSKCGALMMPHRVCKACGSYNKKEILVKEEA